MNFQFFCDNWCEPVELVYITKLRIEFGKRFSVLNLPEVCLIRWNTLVICLKLYANNFLIKSVFFGTGPNSFSLFYPYMNALIINEVY